MPLPEDSLEDHMVKLVAYTIVSLKRDHERVMPKGEGTLIVRDSLSGEAFTVWMISRYLQSDGYNLLTNSEKISEEDKKNLRVHYTVTHRWPREPVRFQEREVHVMEQILDRIGAPPRPNG